MFSPPDCIVEYAIRRLVARAECLALEKGCRRDKSGVPDRSGSPFHSERQGTGISVESFIILIYFTLRSMMASSGQTSWQQKHLMHFE